MAHSTQNRVTYTQDYLYSKEPYFVSFMSLLLLGGKEYSFIKLTDLVCSTMPDMILDNNVPFVMVKRSD